MSWALTAAGFANYLKDDNMFSELNVAKETPFQGAIFKERGQQLALNHSSTWKEKAMEKLKEFIDSRKELKMRDTFTMDMFRYWLQTTTDIGEPKSHNAYGAFATDACRKGLIVPTGDYSKSAMPNAHSRVIRVWRIL